MRYERAVARLIDHDRVAGPREYVSEDGVSCFGRGAAVASPRERRSFTTVIRRLALSAGNRAGCRPGADAAGRPGNLEFSVPGRSSGARLIDGHARRTATITAIQPCETIVIGRNEFEQLRVRYPQIDRFLLASLAANFNRLSEHLLEILFVPTALGWPDGC